MKRFKKSSFQIFGNGNRTLSFPGMAWNGNGNGKKILTGNITKIWEQEMKAISPFGNWKGREQESKAFVPRNEELTLLKTAKIYKNTCSPQCLYLATYGVNVAKMAYLCQKSINPSINCSYFGEKKFRCSYVCDKLS